jgi:hypothetical protein
LPRTQPVFELKPWEPVATGSVVNEGQLQTTLGGYIALLAPEAVTAALSSPGSAPWSAAAGEAITLNADNHLAGITAQSFAIQALVDNVGTIGWIAIQTIGR